MNRIGLQSILDNLVVKNESYHADVPANWAQGRTIYGGLTAGLSLAAARNAFPDLPPLCSLHVNFVGPMGVTPIFRPRLLRQGKNVTMVSVEGYFEDNIVSLTTFVFGRPRVSTLRVIPPKVETDTPQNYEPFTPEFAESVVPGFFLNFDTRLIEGARPMTGAERGYIRTWSRHKDSASREGLISFITLGDVLPPAALPMFKSLGPVSSMNWTMNIFSENPFTQDGWWMVESTLTAAENGYSSQIMRYWNRSGDLVAEGMQAVSIFI